MTRQARRWALTLLVGDALTWFVAIRAQISHHPGSGADGDTSVHIVLLFLLAVALLVALLVTTMTSRALKKIPQVRRPPRA